MILRMKHKRRPTSPLPLLPFPPLFPIPISTTHPIILQPPIRPLPRPTPPIQPPQRLRQILRQHHLIRRSLIPHLPPQRRTRRRTNKEHFLALRRLQESLLIKDNQRRSFPEIDLWNAAHYRCAGELGKEVDGVGGGVEGEDYAAEGAQGGEGVETVRCVGCEEGAEGGEGGGGEDGGVCEGGY